jgi:GT2 family glycosyltransferase
MTLEQYPLVTILIPARNRPNELRHTLRSLRAQAYPAIELLVIDDASDTGIGSVVREEWPEAVCWRNDQNLGLIASRSLGMSKANGEYILSLDDDASLTDPRDIEKAIERIVREPEVGILTFFVHNGPKAPNPEQCDLDERYVHTFMGGAHMIRKQVVETLGGYRDFYFYYGEEAEYSLRVLDAGWRILFFPSVVVHHRVSPEGRVQGRVWGWSVRNNLWTVFLHMPWDRVLLEGGWKLFVNTIELTRRLEVHWGLWATMSFLAGLPSVLRLRRPISRRTLMLYDALRFCQIRTEDEYKAPQSVSLSDLWLWFRKVWWHRRRARPFWDPRPGGVGRSSLASFSDEQ